MMFILAICMLDNIYIYLMRIKCFKLEIYLMICLYNIIKHRHKYVSYFKYICLYLFIYLKGSETWSVAKRVTSRAREFLTIGSVFK